MRVRRGTKEITAVLQPTSEAIKGTERITSPSRGLLVPFRQELYGVV